MSGKPDALMSGETIPCVCLKCNEIKDRLILFNTEGSSLDSRCEECGSQEYQNWDFIKKTCTQCSQGILSIDDEGMQVNSD